MSYLISTTSTTGVVLSNPTTQNPATVTSTGYVSNFYGGDALDGTSAAAWNVTNYGTIRGFNSTLANGISLAAGGVVNNAAGTARITGYVDGVIINGAAGTVSNSGTITGTGTLGNGVKLSSGGSALTNASTGLITGYDGVRIYGPSSTLTNFGTIKSIGTGFG